MITGGQGQALLTWGQAGLRGAGNRRAEGLQEVKVDALPLWGEKKGEATKVSLKLAQKVRSPTQRVGSASASATEWSWTNFSSRPGSCPPASTLLLDAVLEAEAGLVWGPKDLSPQFLEPEAVAPIRRDPVSQLDLGVGGKTMLGTWVEGPYATQGSP